LPNIDFFALRVAAKYIIAACVMICIFFAPAWLAEKNKKDATTAVRVRAASWLFGWTVIGYVYGLYLATAPEKKKG